MAWWTTPSGRRIWMLINDGTVVDATPYAATWARGRTAAEIYTAAERNGATITWTGFDALPTKMPLHLTEHTRIRRWRHPGGMLADFHLEFGRTGDGWYVDVTGTPGELNAWEFPVEDDAVALTRQHLNSSRAWYRVPIGGMSSQLPDPPYDDERFSDTDLRQERQVHAQQ